MLRRMKMVSTVSRLLVVLLLGGPLLLSGPSASAAPCQGTLHADLRKVTVAYALVPSPSGYGYATQPPADTTARSGVSVVVTATRDNGCGVGGARIVLRARNLGQSAFTVVRTGTTNAQGYGDFTVRPPYTTYLQATVQVGNESATSAAIRETVRDNLTAAFASRSDCTLMASGSTYPAKPHHPVWLQRRITRNGSEAGYLTLSKSVTDVSGQYRVVYNAPCGANYALAAYVPASATNEPGRSLYVALHVRATRR